jgi:hypothetical protein
VGILLECLLVQMRLARGIGRPIAGFCRACRRAGVLNLVTEDSKNLETVSSAGVARCLQAACLCAIGGDPNPRDVPIWALWRREFSAGAQGQHFRLSLWRRHPASMATWTPSCGRRMLSLTEFMTVAGFR